jgi:hypothetical protein
LWLVASAEAGGLLPKLAGASLSRRFFCLDVISASRPCGLDMDRWNRISRFSCDFHSSGVDPVFDSEPRCQVGWACGWQNIKMLTERLWLTKYANYLYIRVSRSASNGLVGRITFYFLHEPLETRHPSNWIPQDHGIVIFGFQFRQQLFTQVRRVRFGQCGVVIAHFSDIAVPEPFGQSRLWRHFFDLSMREDLQSRVVLGIICGSFAPSAQWFPW